MNVTGRHLLRWLGPEDSRGKLCETRRCVPQLDRRQKLTKPLLHCYRPGIAALCLTLPVRELIRYLFVGLVLQKASEKKITGFEQFKILKVINVTPRKKSRCLEIQQRRCDEEKLCGLIKIRSFP